MKITLHHGPGKTEVQNLQEQRMNEEPLWRCKQWSKTGVEGGVFHKPLPFTHILSPV